MAPLDCLVIGGGPAGLTAAIYLARFRLGVTVVDAGSSRADLIPLSHNHAGYPEGIGGRDLVARMREQAELYDVPIVSDEVVALDRDGELFVAVGAAGGTWRARSVLLATGVVNHRPEMDDDLHDAALAAGRLRYCPICDGYEVTDRRVGVIARGTKGPDEAVFLRGYTKDVTLIALDGAAGWQDARARLEDAGIALADGPVAGFVLEDAGLRVDLPGGPILLDSLYPAMGSDIRSDLAKRLGANVSPDGCLEVDDHQRTTVAGLYAAGDVVKGLDQISHAMGEGGVAATTIRNDLAKERPFYR